MRPTLKVSTRKLKSYPTSLQTPSRMSLQCNIEDQESATEPPNKEVARQSPNKEVAKKPPNKEDIMQSGSGTSCDAIARPGDRGGQRVL